MGSGSMTMRDRVPAPVRRRARALQESTRRWTRGSTRVPQVPTPAPVTQPQRQEKRPSYLDQWKRRDFVMPAPQRVKWSVLRRYGGLTDVWVETGTYRGDTTAFLARTAAHVHSIEPGPELAEAARWRFRGNSRVTIHQGLSEDRLPGLLETLEGPVSFWLDGHFSAGITFQGPTDTPIREELAVIAQHLRRLGRVKVLVDDVRCFDPSNPVLASYPPRGWLVEWAETNGLTWTIEQDIFAAWS